jgi:hypothetical protein
VGPANVDGLSGVSVGRGWRTERRALKEAETCGVLPCSPDGLWSALEPSSNHRSPAITGRSTVSYGTRKLPVPFIAVLQHYTVVIIAEEFWVKFFSKTPKTVWPQ